jgi:DNA-binding IclR family transcriptional regulator
MRQRLVVSSSWEEGLKSSDAVNQRNRGLTAASNGHVNGVTCAASCITTQESQKAGCVNCAGSTAFARQFISGSIA